MLTFQCSTKTKKLALVAAIAYVAPGKVGNIGCNNQSKNELTTEEVNSNTVKSLNVLYRRFLTSFAKPVVSSVIISSSQKNQFGNDVLKGKV